MSLPFCRIVYGVFSFQYQMVSLILLFSHFEVKVPGILIGLSSFLFNNSGTALSIVMGCSQECFFRSFRQYLPEEYTTAFYVSEPSIAMASAAAPCLPPTVNPVFVYTDIESSSQLWSYEDGAVMRRANELHDEILRSLLAKYRGYEITTCGDAFQLAFHTIRDAVEYCIDAQLRLLDAEWPRDLHNLIPATMREKAKGKRFAFNGLRVRMGIHDAQEVEGVLVVGVHPVTGKVTYTGLSEIIANDMGDIGAGGEICVTRRVARWVQRNKAALRHSCAIEQVGQHRVAQLNIVVDVFDVLPAGLEARKEAFTRHWESRVEAIDVSVDELGESTSRDWDPSSQEPVDSGYSVA
ncbi:hypothetical protein PINS_up019420 [Pythium insidiosum]|nr:hypothetical protein PINS_up019420 [Pythium insidiosum]